MSDGLLDLATELRRRAEAFALATVVRCEPPTSAKPGAKALVRADGTVTGWVGGACAEPVVVREALNALRDGRPRLVGLVGQGGPSRGRTEGILDYPMTCHSGGTLEIYVEPYLPRPSLVLIGHGPVVETLAAIGPTVGYAVTVLGAGAVPDRLDALALTRRAAVVVATHADDDEQALHHVLATEVGYVSLVASRRRAAVIGDGLQRRCVPVERLASLRAPAGLDIGAVTPQEIAISILAEVIQHHREKTATQAPEPTHDAAAAKATDPICGMQVAVATARHRSEALGRILYFCCRQCKDAFDRDPEAHRAALGM